jgi:MAE_28990/MAE_18760-like HEPN
LGGSDRRGFEMAGSRLGSLKLQAGAASAKSDRQRAMLRALWTMLYAHYEGFCKFCWDILLDQIEKDGCSRVAAIEHIARLSLAKEFQEFRKDISAAGIWSFVDTTLPRKMNEPLVFPARLETRSNLWPDLVRENNTAVGLTTNQIDAYSKQLERLTRRLNRLWIHITARIRFNIPTGTKGPVMNGEALFRRFART